MADGAALAHRLVLEDIRPALLGMAPQTHFILGQDRSSSAKVDGAFVRRMTVGAGELSLRRRMVAGQGELAPHVGMALEAEGIGAGRPGRKV